MKKSVLVLLCLCGCFTLGCNSGRPSRASAEREKQKYMKRLEEIFKMMEPPMKILKEIVVEYKDVGFAAVKVKPQGAVLYIDDGEYVDGKNEIMLPVGPHQFMAVWPDGTQVTRDIYVVTALTDIELDYNYDEDDYSMNFDWNTKTPELKKTPVILTKPE